jgi:hypothetical protein
MTNFSYVWKQPRFLNTRFRLRLVIYCSSSASYSSTASMTYTVVFSSSHFSFLL